MKAPEQTAGRSPADSELLPVYHSLRNCRDTQEALDILRGLIQSGRKESEKPPVREPESSGIAEASKTPLRELDILRLVWNHSFDGISVYEEFPEDESRRLVDCNERYAELAGRSRDELLEIGNTMPLITVLEHPHETRAEFIREIRESGVLLGRISWDRPDGRENVIEYMAVPAMIDGRFFVVGVDRDITFRVAAERELKDREEMLRLIFDNSFDGISIYEEFEDPTDRRLIDCNSRYAEQSGRSKEELLEIGNTLSLQLSDLESHEQFRSEVLDKEIFSGQFSWVRPDNRPNRIEFVAVPVRKNGRLLVVGIDRDITEKQQTLKALQSNLREKEVLLKEVHHRVKNNLQIIISLLSLQASKIPDARARDAFTECKNRIFAMALVHESLYQYDNFSMIEFHEYTETLMNRLLRAQPAGARVRLELDIPRIQMPLTRAIPCALILNELMTNSLKHAFRDPGGSAAVRIRLKKMAHNHVEILFADNGAGIPDSVDFETAETLGLNLVRMLIKQMNGSLRLNREDGTEFRFSLPLD